MATMFKKLYRCYPIPHSGPHSHLNSGDKILMPASALMELFTMSAQFPLLFKLANPRTKRVTHCGVMEFSADEGTVLLPNVVMRNVELRRGELVELCNVSLERAAFVKLRPHETAFVELSNPKVVLERALRQFSCLTVGDSVGIDYMDKTFYIDVLETKPDGAVSIIETDCEVEFAPALDYKEPEKPAVEKAKGSDVPNKKEKPSEAKEAEFVPFSGVGRRLGGGVSAKSSETVVRNDVHEGESDIRAPKECGEAMKDISKGKDNLSWSSTIAFAKGEDSFIGKEEEKHFIVKFLILSLIVLFVAIFRGFN